MNKTLDNKLVKKYPQIFKDRTTDIMHSLMGFGFEHDGGWFTILDELCDEIMKVCGDAVPIATQVKEKYGGLRFYVYGGNEAVYKAISKAEDKSLLTCEVCGKAGKLMEKSTHWLKTLCDEDAKKLDYADMV